MATAAPPEVLERFRDGFECWNRDEFERMQDMYAEDAVFDVSAVFTDIAPIQGHHSMRRYWNELRETWEGIRIDPVEAFDLGGGCYVVDLRMSGKGQRSGAEVDQRFGMVYVIRPNEKIAAASLYPDVSTAISAAESR